MAEQKSENTEKTINFCKIETTVSMNEDTYEITEQKYINCTSRNCEVIPISIKNDDKISTSGFQCTAYKYTDEDNKEYKKISVYATNNSGEDKSPIYEDFWYIKLTIKKDSDDKPYIYINFIRNINQNLIKNINDNIETALKEGNQSQLNINCPDEYRENKFTKELKIPAILDITKKIAKNLRITKIVLQDDAEFPCAGDLTYSIKALQLRALQINLADDWSSAGIAKQNEGKLSIYQSQDFKPTKYTNTPIKGCIEALQTITCKKLYGVAFSLKKLFIRINEKETDYEIYKMVINKDEDKLKIEYSEVKENNYSSICENYIKNLDELINLLDKDKDKDDKKIGKFYDEFCDEFDENQKRKENYHCCTLRGKLLGCLKNSVNSYVIVIKGRQVTNSNKETCCDSKLEGMNKLEKFRKIDIPKPTPSTSEPQQAGQQIPVVLRRSVSEPTPLNTYPNGPIIVTKLFNLFNGTFEKLKNIFNHMECEVPLEQQALAGV